MTDKTVIPDEKAHDIAIEISSWLQDACGDLAHCNTWTDIEDWYSDKRGWKKKIKDAKAWGVIDLRGWLADEIYDDRDTMHDLTGDKINDEATVVGFGNNESMIAIANAIIELGAHKSLRLALQEHIRSWKGLKPRKRKRVKRKKQENQVVVEFTAEDVFPAEKTEPEEYKEYYLLIDGKIVDSAWFTESQHVEETKNLGPNECWLLVKAFKASERLENNNV